MSGRRELEHHRILVAEDLEANQELARIYLRAGGYPADFVVNGEEALAAVRSKTYDLVLMDVQMPHMDGIAAAKAIRKLDCPACNIPIVAMTANMLPEQIRCIEAAGMNGHVVKPMEIDDLLSEVARLIGPPKGLHHFAEKTPAEHAPFVVRNFEDFRATIGTEKVSTWLTRLLEELRSTFFDQESKTLDRTQLARRAHAIVSQAGILGFSDLARLCSTLEQACATGGDVSSPFGKAELAARAVHDAVGSLVNQT
jgi:CheY-like chemotaxis protein